jgi:hypothetical protein
MGQKVQKLAYLLFGVLVVQVSRGYCERPFEKISHCVSLTTIVALFRAQVLLRVLSHFR